MPDLSSISALNKKAGNGSRTRDLRITNATLYHLSHTSISVEVTSTRYIILYRRMDVKQNFLVFLEKVIVCQFLYRYYGKKVIILLDEYDTPMQEAYVDGYWDDLKADVSEYGAWLVCRSGSRL